MRVAAVLVMLALSACLSGRGQERWPADAGAVVVKASPHSVEATLDRLSERALAQGAVIRARLSGAAQPGAMSQTLIFSLAELEAPIVAAAPVAGVDLPIRALAFEQEGVVYLAYPAPSAIARRAGVMADAGEVARLSATLNALTDAAVAP